MAGLVKPKKYDWKDSNLALFGSETEKKVKKAAGATERAWDKAGQKPGLQIWRIVKFKVAHWPREDYGKFYSGDSYIILNTYKKAKSNELLYDLHFWIGKYSTQDEYGAAAYKTVELDIFLDDKPVQHREVQQHESDLFKSYFKEISILKGGADTGFRHVKPETYVPRLMHFRRVGKKSVEVKEVALFRESLDSDDVFILDGGLELYQWNGEKSNKDERYHAMQYMQKLRSQRNSRPKMATLEEGKGSAAFFAKLPEGGTKKEKKNRDVVDAPAEKKLFKVSDSEGGLQVTQVATGTINKDDLRTEDAFVLDTGDHVFVWVGAGTSEAEKKESLPLAHKYLQQSNHPFAPATVIHENMGESKEFEAAFD